MPYPNGSKFSQFIEVNTLDSGKNDYYDKGPDNYHIAFEIEMADRLLTLYSNK
jgi:hypothetical protein